MNILGINYYYHDTTASIVMDGELTLLSKKSGLHEINIHGCYPYQSIKKVMEVAQLEPKGIDHIAVSIQPTFECVFKIILWAA